MSHQFGLTGPFDVMQEYESLFREHDIFYTQVENSNGLQIVVLEDTNNVYSLHDGFIAQVSVLISEMSSAHGLYPLKGGDYIIRLSKTNS